MKEAIILAGGFGTRLQHVLGTNIPKPLAPVSGRPFLTYLLRHLEIAGYQHVVLSTGYLSERIEQYFGEQFGNIHLSYAREEHPLFTGGAIAFALQQTLTDNVLVINGDTLFDIPISELEHFHEQHKADVSVALRKVDDTSRYGRVETNVDNRITSFCEKNLQDIGCGMINGGIYMIRKAWLLSVGLPEKFSFEKEVLQTLTSSIQCYGKCFEDYFIDIGIPNDYYRAQKEFSSLFTPCTDLFLDRDGVLNVHRENDYVKAWAEWQWIEGVKEALAIASNHYRHICLISNQRGISRGLFTLKNLDEIHHHMILEIEAAGGRLDHIYVCTDLSGPNRKPETGMALQAKQDYPEIDFRNVVMIGDSLIDLQFGYRLGMKCVFLTNGKSMPQEIHDYTDLCFANLYEAIKQLVQ